MRLEELPQEHREDPDLRNKIFEEVIGEDGHGRVHLQGVGIRPTPKRAKHVASLHSSVQEKKIEELETIIMENNQQCQEENARNKAEIDNLKSQLDFVFGALRRVDPSLLEPTNPTPIDPSTALGDHNHS